MAVELTRTMRFGPAMTALNDRQRAFVVAYNDAGGRNASAAVREAGYASRTDSDKVQAHRLLHDPTIQAAIREDVLARFVGDAAQAQALLREIALNPKHRDHYKAVMATLHQAGLIETTRTEHTETIVLTYEQRMDRLRQIAAQNGKPMSHYMPAGVTVTDAEYAEVTPEEDEKWW